MQLLGQDTGEHISYYQPSCTDIHQGSMKEDYEEVILASITQSRSRGWHILSPARVGHLDMALGIAIVGVEGTVAS